MGTWDIGPFDNDTAADFAGDLDEAALEEREAMMGSVNRTVYRGWLGLLTSCGEPAVEGDVEGVQSGLPAQGPA
ncbi:DUF4259 domain-containing protein, partial [Streptomyces sp. NPDC057193]|uniref:DUF4259 domain-containing protein n=1 Tax=Streptomyces sp. NPDC057193 TaxID=3346043 RepID=UPI0036430EAF